MKFLIALAMTLSFTSAMAATGTLEGSCLVFQEDDPNDRAEMINFTVTSKDQFFTSRIFSVKIPLKNTYNDDYSIVVQNTAGLTKDDTWSPDRIVLSVGAKRYFCNPPILEEGGVSRTPCDRPQGWVTLGGSDQIVAPKDGDTLRFSQSSEQIGFVCKATFKEL